MALNGIDISNYQRGLDLAQVPCDFVICNDAPDDDAKAACEELGKALA